MLQINLLRSLYFISALLCWLFFYFSNGLIFYDESTNSYLSVNTLYTSGSDDDIAIWILGLVNFITFAVLLFKKYSQQLISIIIALSLVLQMTSLILIQMGSVIITIFVGKDLFLGGMLISQILAVIIWMRGFWIAPLKGNETKRDKKE
jgi:hypothetical protein